MASIFVYGLIVWVILSIFAVINGLLRNYGYKPKLGELRAHQLSTIIFITIVLLVTYFYLKILGQKYPATHYWLLGLMWAAITIAFEFLFGHYFMKHPWKKLLADYNMFNGRLWLLVLFTIIIAPPLVGGSI